jgi:hypothetical protein
VQRGRQFAALGAGRESDFLNERTDSVRCFVALLGLPQCFGKALDLPTHSAMAFDDLGDYDSDICGGVFSVKPGYRPNLEFEHAIRPAPAFLRSA